MRGYVMCIGLLALLSCCAFAQTDTPRFEVFGGYSYLHSHTGSAVAGANANGWNASAMWNWNRHWGIKADVDGHYCCDGERLHNFLAGPQYTIRMDNWNVFFHGLGGMSHGSVPGFSESTGAWAAGAGIDVDLFKSQRVAVRLIQGDYIGTMYGGTTQHHFRYSGGFVLRLGKK